MIEAVKTDITKIKKGRVQVIVNAANGRGPMNSGVAGAIRRAAGEDLQEEVREICRSNGYFKEGDCYISPSGELGNIGIEHIYHAVTMEYPGGRSSLEFVGKAMRSVLDKAVENGVKSIAIPGLGTGVGALNPKSVASIMVSVARTYENKLSIMFADTDDKFINAVKERLEEINNERRSEQSSPGSQ